MSWKLQSFCIEGKRYLEKIYIDGKEIPFSREDPLYLRLDNAIRNFDRRKRCQIILRWARWIDKRKEF